MSYSKYINTFPNAEAYETYKASSDFKRPNVAWIQDENRVVYEGGQEELPDSGGGSDEKFEKLKEFINKRFDYFANEDYFEQENFKFPEGLEHLKSGMCRYITHPADDCFDNIRKILSDGFGDFYGSNSVKLKNLEFIENNSLSAYNISEFSFYDCDDSCIVQNRAFGYSTNEMLSWIYFYNCGTAFIDNIRNGLNAAGYNIHYYDEGEYKCFEIVK